MSLKVIRSLVVPIIGLGKSNLDEIAYVNAKINEAALEVYRTTDHEGSLKEQIFALDENSQQISLPTYVANIRGMRYYENRSKITLNDMRPRYHTTSWGKTSINYRDKGVLPLKVDITNSSLITLSMPFVEPAIDFTVSIVGSTPVASRVSEVILFTHGVDTVKTSINSFINVESIRKSALNSYDITITDVDERELAVIPNSEYLSQYRILQVTSSCSLISYIEVLYKTRFTPMRNDDDEFQCNACDELIKWKFLEHYYAEQKGEEAIKAALSCMAKFNKALTEKINDDERGRVKLMDFGRNRFHDIIDEGYYPGIYSIYGS